MSHIVIIGQDLPAVQAAEQVRRDQPDWEISLVGLDGDEPYDPLKFPDLIAQSAQRRDVFACTADRLKNLRIAHYTEQPVTRINLKRKTVSFQDKSRLEADVMILAGAPKYRFPDIKGTHRGGVYHMKMPADLDQLLKGILDLDTVFVQAESFYALRLALALSRRDKEVVICTSGTALVRDWDEESGRCLAAFLETRGIRVMPACPISEVLGDQDVKAVRLSSGKVISAEAVIFDDARPDLRIYGDDIRLYDGRIAIDGWGRTSLENIYAAGMITARPDLPSMITDTEDYREDAPGVLASVLTGREDVPSVVAGLQTASLAEQRFDWWGSLTADEAQAYVRPAESGRYARLLVKENEITAGVIQNDEQTARFFYGLSNDISAEDLFRQLEEQGFEPWQDRDQPEEAEAFRVPDELSAQESPAGETK
ncbi:MAG: FAD-dependent oxidoreductase [Candidatus Omnitrophota bacterium]